VSLLLDALKRAEQDKQAGQAGRENTGPHLVAAGKPTLELHPISSPEAAPASPRAAPQGAAPQAIAPVAAAPVRDRRCVFWAAGAIIVLVIAAVMGYVWYSIAALAPRPAAVARARPRRVRSCPRRAPKRRLPWRPFSTVRCSSPRAAPCTAREDAERAAASPKAGAKDSPPTPAALLQPSRVAERARVMPEIVAAAMRHCAAAISRRRCAPTRPLQRPIPRISTRRWGSRRPEARAANRDSAAAHYRRALEVDPRNATALAGLAALMDLSRSDALEPQLLRDISHHPESAALNFMLGNLSRLARALEPGASRVFRGLPPRARQRATSSTTSR
jgi:hypothetical protein